MLNITAPIAIVYHAHCHDGLTALAIAIYHLKHTLNRTDYSIIEGYHQAEPDYSLFAGKFVLIVDFSYSVAVLENILAVAQGVLILDHHVSAYNTLKDFSHPKLEFVYDVSQCGALMTWARFFPNQNPPLFLQYINDRDLWLKQFPDTDYFSLALRTRNYSRDEFVSFIGSCIAKSSDNACIELIEQGKAFKVYQDELIKQIARGAYAVTLDDGTPAMKCNAPMALASEIGEYLAKNHTGVAWIFEQGETAIKNSLRVASDCDFDASVYATQKGGGGHKKASGWREFL